jgi:dolichyl-phosphate beta-glucosyltransferase
MPTPTLTIVIPAFNEEGRLAPTVRGAVACARERRAGAEVIVVDDGSRDGTSALVQRLAAELPEVRLVRLAANHGKGYAVRSGMLNATGDLVLFADADGATPWDQLGRLEAAIASGADVAIGSRALGSPETRVQARWYRRAIGRTFHRFVELLTVRGFKDTQCGFKLFRGPVAQDLFARMRMDGFSFDVEVLLMAQRGGHPVAEVPVNWVHQPGSRVSLVRDSLRMLRDLFVIRGRALRGDYDRPHVAVVGGPGANSLAEPPAA